MPSESVPSKQEQVIFHVDLDAFFVEVERQKDKSLSGKPVVIGGTGPRGVVATASYEARKYGIQSAMATSIARRLCPNAIFMSGNNQLYQVVSKKFMEILHTYSPQVVPVSVDEAYLDMTGTHDLFGAPIHAAKKIRLEIRNKLGLPSSIGIGPNKLVAKVATEHAKPNNIFQVIQSEAELFFAPQPVRNLPGIGPKAEETLIRLKINTLGQLADAAAGPLRRALGTKHQELLQIRARGIDNSPLKKTAKSKSISAETTFEKDVSNQNKLHTTLKRLCERVGSRLRKSGLMARGVSIKIRYGDFTTITRQSSFAIQGNGDLLIYSAALELLTKAMEKRRDPVRLIGITATGIGQVASQLSLLDQDSRIDSSTSAAIDEIRKRYGSESIFRGSVQ
ncbi:MAG: DNA polymerase IV [SAR202 cluster bacterium]|nr:DNA polymerase IV [Myxococcales bacterium]MQG87976.1 DNA polymerase IV [SAR202 cluster bacterium]|tara:strand:+ start:1106 stop:2287 length:1182 start_codon:yes stop_codon:yes gene_type:complete